MQHKAIFVADVGFISESTKFDAVVATDMEESH